MDIPQLVVTILTAVAGPAASIRVASYSAGRTLADLEKRLAALDTRLTSLETTEPADVAKIRTTVAGMHDAIEALARDLATVRGAFEKHEIAEERRREKAGERAEAREQREQARVLDWTDRLARFAEMVSSLREEMRDARRQH